MGTFTFKYTLDGADTRRVFDGLKRESYLHTYIDIIIYLTIKPVMSLFSAIKTAATSI